MTASDIQTIADTVQSEGFEYAFVAHSTFQQITDERFHELREAYLKGRRELDAYLESAAADHEVDWDS